MGVHVKKMAILEKKLDRPSGTLGCPIDELARMLGFRYVLACGRAVMWAPQGQKGLKKTLSAWPQGQGCGKLKTIGPIRLEGVKSHPSSYLHFFTGHVWVLHRYSRANPYCVHCSLNQKKFAVFFCLQTIPGAPLRAPRSAKMDHKNANFGPAEPEISIIITKSLF